MTPNGNLRRRSTRTLRLKPDRTLLSRDLFLHVDRMVYLEHAAQAPLARPVLEAVNGYLAERSETNPNNHVAREAAVERVREAAGRLLGSPADRIEIAPTTTWGLNILALGYPWRAGDRVAVPACEFPANLGPWLQLERFGVEVGLVPHTRGVVTVDDIERALTPRTRLVAISWVQYLSGYRIDVARLAEVVHANGSLLCVDATQGLGALRLDAVATGADFVAAGAQKWLLGLQGAAILYVTPEMQDRLAPIRGWLNGPMTVGEEMVLTDELHPDARRFRVTATPMAPVVALEASLAMLEAAGHDDVERDVLARARRLAAGLEQQGFRLYGDGDVASGIVTIDHPDPVAAHARLRARDIHISVRDRRLRFSPHAYNSDEEIDATLDALADA